MVLTSAISHILWFWSNNFVASVYDLTNSKDSSMFWFGQYLGSFFLSFDVYDYVIKWVKHKKLYICLEILFLANANGSVFASTMNWVFLYFGMSFVTFFSGTIFNVLYVRSKVLKIANIPMFIFVYILCFLAMLISKHVANLYPESGNKQITQSIGNMYQWVSIYFLFRVNIMILASDIKEKKKEEAIEMNDSTIIQNDRNSNLLDKVEFEVDLGEKEPAVSEDFDQISNEDNGGSLHLSNDIDDCSTHSSPDSLESMTIISPTS